MTEKEFDYYLEGQTGKWEVIIGLEVHAQVTSNAKLFSSSPTIKLMFFSIKCNINTISACSSTG